MGLLDIKLPSEDGRRGLFSLGKRFWAYVRSQRRDQVGITRLKEGNIEITNPKERAHVLGRQYDSVFTDENLTFIPEPNTLSFPDIDNLYISTHGVEQLLMSLKVKKAIVPDLLTIRVLKEAANEIAPILQVIFQASIDRSAVPKDWHSANKVSCLQKNDSNPAQLTTDQFPSLQYHGTH